MIAPTPSASDGIAHHGLANAAKRIEANMDRRAEQGHTPARQTESGHTPGANALERVRDNAARIEAKRGTVEPEPKDTPVPADPAPAPEPTISPAEPGVAQQTEPWSVGRFEIIV